MADATTPVDASHTDTSTALNDIATNGNLLNQAIGQLTQTLGNMQNIVLPVTSGGTGLAHSDAGGLLVGAASNTYTILDDAATGNALISGGAGIAPSWGKIGLTTHVSGILPITNGGTNASSFTAYAVLCGGTTGTGTLQSIASVGTSGVPLISNGASALPTFGPFVDGIGGIMSFPSNGTYRIWLSSPFAMTVTGFSTICASGSCTAELATDPYPTAIATNSVTTSFAFSSASQSIAVADNLFIIVSANSSCQNFSFMIKYTRP